MRLQINNGEFSGGIDVKNGSVSISDGTVSSLTVSGGNVQITGGTFESITALNGGKISDLLAEGYALKAADGALVNMYTDKISQNVTAVCHTHDLGGIGTCACGYEEKAVDSDNDGAVEISTLGQLQWFAYQINCGKTLNAVLANDIDLDGKNVVIGTAANPFSGVFDGKGAKITNYNLDVSENDRGFSALYTAERLKISKFRGDYRERRLRVHRRRGRQSKGRCGDIRNCVKCKYFRLRHGKAHRRCCGQFREFKRCAGREKCVCITVI